MTHTTTTSSASYARVMGNGNKKSTLQSASADDLPKHSLKSTNNKSVAEWSSKDVQHWIKQQCKKYEFKTASVENFAMNGRALMLLSKHDFIRRSPDGGEILYYALQHLINPNKINSARLDQSLSNGGSSGQHPRIVEISGDSDEFITATDSSSPKPIVEDPDDPPIIRRSQSDTNHNDYQQQQQQQPLFFFQQAPLRPAVLTMSAGSAAAYFQQQQGFPNTVMHTQHHPHLHMHQPFLFQPQLLHQYHPMMAARGILIEIMDDTDLNNNTSEGVNGLMNGAQGSLYMVTINGDRYIMNEEQVKQLVTEVHQRQTLQDLQRQHLQQLFFHQQQQQLQQLQQQQYFQQQQHLRQQQNFQQQPQQRQQQQSQQHF